MRFVFVPALLCILGVACTQAADYTPDIAEFDGSRSVAIAPDDVFQVDGDVTIEFWLAADWKDDPGFDPVVISNTGLQGASYIVAILRDRDGVGVLSGGKETLAPFDFTDGKLHHVAIIQSDGELIIVVDGSIRGMSEEGLTPLPMSGLWIGSADGQTAPFTGAIGQVRLWDAALDLDTLETFKMTDVLAESGLTHPFADRLLAASVFPEPGLFLHDPADE